MTTVDTPATDREDGGRIPPARGRLAVATVALGLFSLMTSELLPVGLLTSVGSDLGVSPGTAGLMVTVPGLVAAVSAPLVAVAAGRVDRRTVLAVLLGLVAVANLVCATADHFAVVLTARFLVGISVGGFWAVVGGIAPRLVPRERVPRATAAIFAGVGAASVLGVPTGTFVGHLAGWRTAFAAVGVLALVVLGCLVALMPKVPARRGVRLADLPGALGGGTGVRTGIALLAFAVTGHFAAYTFVRPVLRDDGVPEGAVGALLLLFGAACVAGTFAAGALAERSRRTAAGACTVLVSALILLAATDTGVLTAGALLALWGFGYGAVPVTFQNRILRAAPEPREAASALYVSAFNTSVAVGALLGGLAVDASGPQGALWTGAAIAVLVPLVLVGAARVRPAVRPGASSTVPGGPVRGRGRSRAAR
ncbi:MFS transporter [Streptomyces sp. TRM43335]|uniref:MFS transporter n=1 Tax=Streptomyces taklimakanensis TaxID=2569853 RepID=A0A6G2BJK3_9ACTN|nr:MFS transporter [Streptomyces taklimakanensis]